jgi:carboxypeptidase C (cathepsin A)
MAAYLLFLSLSVLCARSFLLTKSSPYLHSAHQNWSLIKPQLASILDTSDVVNIYGYPGYAGMIEINTAEDQMFYWFVNKVGGNVTTDNVPVIMWLQGGPGCSSMIGAFFEHGPLYIDENQQVQNRTGTWVNSYHILYVDNPVGAGYSVKGPSSSYVTSEYQMASNLYTFLQAFATLHPEVFNNHEFYIFGESYAGKYVPSIAYHVLKWNQNATLTGLREIPLKGMAMGDGLTDPIPQFTYYSDYGFAAGLIDEKEREQVQVYERQSIEHIYQQNWEASNNAQNSALQEVITQGGGVNMYNIRYFGEYNTTIMDTWLNSTSTKAQFRVPEGITFQDCGSDAYNALANDIPQSVAWTLPFILSQIRVLIYNGQDDLLVNMVGAETWVSLIPWSGQSQYLSAMKQVWSVGGAVAGYVRGYSNLMQVVVLEAGHMVPHDQLVNSLDMVTRFITNAPWSD